MTEIGAYGLAASNGFSEALTGKDMFGQKVSKEKQAQGFIDATLNMVGAKAAAGTRAVSGTTRAAARARNVAKPSQRMTHLIKAATKKYPLAKSPIDVIMKQTKKMLKHVGRIKVPVKPRLHVHQPVAATGHHIGIPSIHMHVEKKTLGEIGHGVVKFARGSGSAKLNKALKEEFDKAVDKAMEDAIKKQPPYNRKPIQPRKYKDKKINKDGSKTYTIEKHGKEFVVTYDRDGHPIFTSEHQTSLPESKYLAGDKEQFKHLSKELYEKAMNNQKIKSRFTDDELEILRNGETPKRFVWHHHQEPGKMQLVNSEIHDAAKHTGGRAYWGGGTNGRKGKIKSAIKKQVEERFSWEE
ncbi:HNH endonuclease [Bacillus sp. CLL-7-23]|uniref:HNH endonuclease n=1 Tax=Bacillus changyiensis TaxID=3004103 RepID=A0ABT4X5N9_9BACI|nr:HNH endonuclease [Bacillus changyiensis]MDA7027417.1 HNH endonuclease [Bacillus changyiensis]